MVKTNKTGCLLYLFTVSAGSISIGCHFTSDRNLPVPPLPFAAVLFSKDKKFPS